MVLEILNGLDRVWNPMIPKNIRAGRSSQNIFGLLPPSPGKSTQKSGARAIHKKSGLPGFFPVGEIIGVLVVHRNCWIIIQQLAHKLTPPAPAKNIFGSPRCPEASPGPATVPCFFRNLRSVFLDQLPFLREIKKVQYGIKSLLRSNNRGKKGIPESVRPTHECCFARLSAGNAATIC